MLDQVLINGGEALKSLLFLILVLLLLGCSNTNTNTNITEVKERSDNIQTVVTEDVIKEVVLVNKRCIGKVDINTAPIEDLKKIIHIDDEMALEIIEKRPYVTIDSLAVVRGIYGEVLTDIKRDELTCIEREIR